MSLTRINRVNDSIAGMYIAVVSNKSTVAYAAGYRIANPVADRRTVTSFHAVVTEVTLWANCCKINK